VDNTDGIPEEIVNEIRVALKELELDENLQTDRSMYDLS